MNLSPHELSVQDVVFMLHELHKLGYEQLRLYAGMSPNGGYWRWMIYPKCLLLNQGDVEHNRECLPFYTIYSSTGCLESTHDSKELAVQFLADNIEYLSIGRMKCNDGYIEWFDKYVLENVKSGRYPVAFQEFMPNVDGWLMCGEDYREIIPYPPFTSEDLEHIPDDYVVIAGKYLFDEYQCSYLKEIENYKGRKPSYQEVANAIRECIKRGNEWKFITRETNAYEQVMSYPNEIIATRRDEDGKIFLKLINGKEMILEPYLDIHVYRPSKS